MANVDWKYRSCSGRGGIEYQWKYIDNFGSTHGLVGWSWSDSKIKQTKWVSNRFLIKLGDHNQFKNESIDLKNVLFLKRVFFPSPTYKGIKKAAISQTEIFYVTSVKTFLNWLFSSVHLVNSVRKNSSFVMNSKTLNIFSKRVCNSLKNTNCFRKHFYFRHDWYLLSWASVGRDCGPVWSF